MEDTIAQDYAKAHPKRDVAVVLLINSNNEILMVRTHKLPNSWQPIGGGVDDTDTDPKHAAVREVSEELGISITTSDLTMLSPCKYDFGEGTVYGYYAHLPQHIVDSISLDKTEELLEARWLYIEDAVNLQAYPATKNLIGQLSTILAEKESYSWK